MLINARLKDKFDLLPEEIRSEVEEWFNENFEIKYAFKEVSSIELKRFNENSSIRRNINSEIWAALKPEVADAVVMVTPNQTYIQ